MNLTRMRSFIFTMPYGKRRIWFIRNIPMVLHYTDCEADEIQPRFNNDSGRYLFVRCSEILAAEIHGSLSSACDLKVMITRKAVSLQKVHDWKESNFLFFKTIKMKAITMVQGIQYGLKGGRPDTVKLEKRLVFSFGAEAMRRGYYKRKGLSVTT